MNRTLHSSAHVKSVLVGSQAATKTGDVIDRDNYRDAIVHILATNITGTPTGSTIGFKIQHSDTETSADFVDATIQGVPTTLTVDTEGELHVNLDGFKRYIRIVATANFTGGTAPKADLIGTVVLGNMISNPVRTAPVN